MAIDVMNWVWDHSKSRHGARLVMLAIADCVKNDGGWAWPSVRELGRKTQLVERAVRSAIAELSGLGELEVQVNGGPSGCNRYRVITHTPAYFAGAESAPLQGLHLVESSQVDGQAGAESAGADSAPLQKTTPDPAESAPGTVKNHKTSSSKKKKNAGDEPPREDVERICTHLADRIVANGSKRPEVTSAWRTAARLLLDRDGRTEDQIHTAIDWCQGSGFWCSKVMSMPKLRDKYDQLRLEAKAERDRLNGGNRSNFRGGGAADPLTDQQYGKGSTRI